MHFVSWCSYLNWYSTRSSFLDSDTHFSFGLILWPHWVLYSMLSGSCLDWISFFYQFLITRRLMLSWGSREVRAMRQIKFRKFWKQFDWFDWSELSNFTTILWSKTRRNRKQSWEKCRKCLKMLNKQLWNENLSQLDSEKNCLTRLLEESYLEF